MNIDELNIFVPGQATPSDVGQLNRWNANPMTPNPGLWLVESVMNIDENIFRMPIYPMLNHMNIDELNISFYVKPRPLRSRSNLTLWPECSQT